MRRTNEDGLTTAEYAVGTVAAAGFGGALLLLTPVYHGLLLRLFAVIVRASIHSIVPW